MKALQKTFTQFEQIANEWVQDIELYTDEQFLRKPAEDQWSIGQVYVHLIQSAVNFHLAQIQLCSKNRGTVIGGGKKLPGIISYTIGMLPPVRIKVPPSPTYTPQQPKSKQEVVEQLEKLIQTVKDAIPLVKNSSPTQKTEHPALGFLNAREWYRLILMHYRHHRRQQARLNKMLGVMI